MKFKYLVILILTILLGSCDKKEDNIYNNKTPSYKQYDNDGIINPVNVTLGFSTIPLSYKETTCSLDIDHNGSADVFFIISIDPDYKNFKKNISIKTLNNFEFAIQDTYEIHESNFNSSEEKIIDTVVIKMPKSFNLNDTISNSPPYNNKITKLTYYQSWIYNNYRGGVFISGWNGIGVKYIGIRNNISDILGWIKIEVIDSKKVKINSFFYIMGEEYLLIKNN